MKQRTSFQIFKSVISALFLREVQTRFGTRKLGYFWAIFDSMTMILMFAGLRQLISPRSLPGLDYPVFLATGFLAFFLWKNIVNNSIAAFSTNRALFSYIQVKPIDTIISRFLLQFLVSIMATIVFLLIGAYFGFDIKVKNFNMLILGVLWFSLFGLSIGIFSAVISHFYEMYEKILSLLMMPLLFVSALMYTVGSLPQQARELILYNPLVHFVEMIHGNYFDVLDTHYVDYTYMFWWTILPLFFGLFFYRRAEKKIISS